MIHRIKIEKHYYERLVNCEKKAEIRKNDRDYQVGDTLKFILYDKDSHQWEEAEHFQAKITHIHGGLGMEEGYVALSVNMMPVGPKE